MSITLEKVAMFVAYMDSMDHARTTIRTYISALSREHKPADEDAPTAKFWVRKVMDAAGLAASSPRVKRQITLEILKKILWAANRILVEFDKSLMRAVFSLAFHACTRIVEMVSFKGQSQHAVLVQNMVFRAREVSIAFVSFKHHKGNEPETRILQGASPDVCPSAMLRDYAKHRPVHWTGLLFVWKSGEQVEVREVRCCLPCCLAMAEEDAVDLSPHSFRIGAVSNAVARGASEGQLCMMGRWRSNAYMRYVRPSQRMPLH